MLKYGVTTTPSPTRKRESTIAFVAWSAATTAAASRNQSHALDIFARLPRPAEVQPAASAEPFRVDVGAIMPAAVAFRLRARRDFHRRRAFMRACSRRDHQELELFAEARERVVVGAVGREVDLGLQ